MGTNSSTTLGRTDERFDTLLLTVPEAAKALALGRTKVYELIGAGEIEVIHIGRAVRVPAEAVTGFVARKRRAPFRYKPSDSAVAPGDR